MKCFSCFTAPKKKVAGKQGEDSYRYVGSNCEVMRILQCGECVCAPGL